MNTDDTIINEIKKLSRKLADDNITFPVEEDYLLIEQAMLRGVSIAFRSLIEKETKSIINEKTDCSC
ncbi:MAG: hypothetical protein NUV47_01160 [Patescibacteria group bacterium]|nr:hypothetical protein [Patescibacteria group bacterium]